MKNKTTTKDFYREIKKSPGRFLSIFFIVIMGVPSGLPLKITPPAFILLTGLVNVIMKT